MAEQTQIWARIDKGVVVEIVTLPASLTPGREVFHASLIFVRCDEHVAIGMRYADGKFSAAG